MFGRLKRFGETTRDVTALAILFAGIFTGFCRIFSVALPPWVTAADGQTILDRLNKSDVTQRSLQIEIISQQLSRAWDAYHANPNDANARADIWRYTRALKQLDPTIPLPPVP